MKSRYWGCATLLSLTVAVGRSSEAGVVIDSLNNVPTGVNYVNFDKLHVDGIGGEPDRAGGFVPNTPGSATSGGVSVSFTGNRSGAVQGEDHPRYQAPQIENSIGMLFGDSALSGPDETPYLMSAGDASSVILTFTGMKTYFGLLWGSVDSGNLLEFFDGATSIGRIRGSDVINAANGATGTFYVNIVSDVGFDSVVIAAVTGKDTTFELDNVAYAPGNAVPEPSTMALAGLGMVSMLVTRIRRRSWLERDSNGPPHRLRPQKERLRR